MKCPSKTQNGQLRLIEFASGRAGAVERMELQLHADSCPECCSLIVAHRQVFAALDTWEAVPPSFGFDCKLYARVEQESQATWARLLRRAFDHRLWMGRPAYPLAAAVLLVAVFFAGDASRWITGLRGLTRASYRQLHRHRRSKIPPRNSFATWRICSSLISYTLLGTGRTAAIRGRFDLLDRSATPDISRIYRYPVRYRRGDRAAPAPRCNRKECARGCDAAREPRWHYSRLTR